MEKLAMPLNRTIKVLALRDKNEKSLSRSASGGAFAVLARAVLKDGGIVFGTELCADNIARITSIEKESDLWRLQGSKYVQSLPGDSFRICRRMLKDGRTVLFSGTPCQIYALRYYLMRDEDQKLSEKLLTVDLVCHGVTDPRLFKLYIDWLENSLGARRGTLRYSFRSKKVPWGSFCASYSYKTEGDSKGRTRVVQARYDPYYRAYLSGKYYRRSCYSCRFSQQKRVSDFTIGDYWGIEDAHPHFYDKRGVSLLLVNTALAESFFISECESECDWVESSLELACRDNANLIHPSIRSEEDEENALRLEKAVLDCDSKLAFEDILSAEDVKFRVKRAICQLIMSFRIMRQERIAKE